MELEEMKAIDLALELSDTKICSKKRKLDEISN
jgi:hypothetical protein